MIAETPRQITLEDVQYIDLYLSMADEGELKAHFSGMGSGGIAGIANATSQVVSELLKDQLKALYAAITEKCRKLQSEDHGRDGFSVRHNGRTYRVSVMQSLRESVFVVRPFPVSMPSFNDLGLIPGYVEQLMQPKLKGLVVVCGSMGSGKTTTGSSMVVERVKRFGGIAVTIEDPAEMPMEGNYVDGRYAEGVIYQTEIGNGGFEEAMRRAVRWGRGITIYVGEIRDARTCLEVLRAAVNGHLVVATTHADSVQSAIARLHSWASTASGGDASTLLADALSIILLQKLEEKPNSNEFRLLSSMLSFVDPATGKSAKAMVAKQQINDLTNVFNQQNNRMRMGMVQARGQE